MLVINNISTCVLAYDNHFLIDSFTIDEFKNSIFQMNSDKSPSPNGLYPTAL